MKNSEYWKQRFTQLEAAQNSIGAMSLAEIENQYREAQNQIELQISAWYQRFAKNNGITMAEARQWLTGKDLKEFKWDVWDYIKRGEENAITGEWMKELENASARFHISKLEALKIHTQQSMQELFAKQQRTVTRTMGDIFKSGYYHTAYELQRGFNIGWDIGGIDQRQIEKVLSKPWAADGKNFSDRIWENKEKLINEAYTEISRNIITGGDPQKAIDAIAKKLNTSKTNAGRLVMTEEAYFSSAAQKDCFNDLDVEEYEIVATLDSHTSDICRSLDGKHFPMKDFEPETTAPPFHVWCRSTTVPYFEDDFGEIGERAARDKEGKTYYVPADMTYKQWEQTFVDDGDKKALTLADSDDIINHVKGVDIFNDYGAPENAKITADSILKELETSPIGKEAVKYMLESGIRPRLVYEKQLHANRGEQIGDNIQIYVSNLKNDRDAAQVVVHELTHLRYNIGNCQWAEVVCCMSEKMHIEGRSELSEQEKRRLIRLVKSAYPELKWKKGGYNGGHKF